MTGLEGERDSFVEALLEDDVEQLYERAPIGYLSTDPGGLLVKVNETFLALTGYARDDVVRRRRFVELLSPAGRIYYETHVAPMLRLHDAAREIALDLVAAGGRRLPVLVTAVLERDADGVPRVTRMAVFDARERRRYEQELLAERRRAEESQARALELAHALQRSLLPPELPVVPGLELAAAFRPADVGDVVGGDFYDVFQHAPDDWVVVIGDVCGKGPDAAVVTGLVRHTLRAAAVTTPQPRRLLRVANSVVVRQGSERFCTALVLRLRRRDGRWTVTVSNAGHPPALSRDGRTVRSFGEPSPPLGVVDDLDVATTTLSLPPSRTLLVHTDGVTEARAGGDFFGERRLHELVVGGDRAPGELVSQVLREAVDFQGGRCRDDIAVLALRAVPSRQAVIGGGG